MKYPTYNLMHHPIVYAILIILYPLIQIGCVSQFSSASRESASPIPSIKSYNSLENIPTNIDSNISVNSIQFANSGDLLLGTNFGLIKIKDTSNVELLSWGKLGDVVEQISIDKFDGATWLYNRFGGIIVNREEIWQNVLKPQDLIENRGDAFRRYHFVSVDNSFYLETSKSILELNRRTMRFEPIVLPKTACLPNSQKILSEDGSISQKSPCIVTTGKFNNKLVLVLRSQPVLDIFQNDSATEDSFDQIFIYDNKKWNQVIDNRQTKIKIRELVDRGDTGIILTNDGNILELTNNGILQKIVTPEKVVAIENSDKYGIICVLQSGKVVVVQNGFPVVFELEQQFPDSYYKPIIDANQNKVAVAWTTEKNCINITVWDGSEKLVRHLCH